MTTTPETRTTPDATDTQVARRALVVGMGRHAATHLGTVDNLHDRGKGAGNYKLARTGLGGPTVGFADAPANVGPWMMLCGDVENAAYTTLPDDTPVHYSTRPVQIEQNDQKVRVTLKNTSTGEKITSIYDLVVGADGIHSSVREQVFGPHEKYTHSLDLMICAFELPENPPTLGPATGAILTEPERSFWVFPFTDHPATVILTYHTDDPEAERTRPVVERLREVYGPAPTATS